jgi:sulfur carrier protein
VEGLGQRLDTVKSDRHKNKKAAQKNLVIYSSIMTAKVTANKQLIEVNLPCSLKEFIEKCDLLTGSVVVELNGLAISPSEFSTKEIQDGDQLEIVNIVAGG